MNFMERIQAKTAAAQKAARLIQEGQTVGLGTGSTAECFIAALAERCGREGLRIQTVSSSAQSESSAKRQGLNVIEINRAARIDITVDGADQVDRELRMIKGRGGAHVREKILAASSIDVVAIIDDTKWVGSLGGIPLPLEVIPYGSEWTKKKVESLGFPCSWRLGEGRRPLVSENGHLILDLALKKDLENPEQQDALLRAVPGVVDTGFFLGIAHRVIIGYEDGATKEYTRTI